MTRIGFGIDVGGSGIKGAVVDLDKGDFVGERIKILTPQPATPAAVADTVKEIVAQAKWDGPVGITIPSAVKNQTALMAANIDKSWVNTDAHALFSRALGTEDIYVLNDADAAGLAEVTYGVPEASHGPVILVTLGTGIGTALLIDGTLYPNTELGHLTVDGHEAEKYASSAVREKKDLSYKKWAKRVSKVLNEYEHLFWPSLFIVGGGISRKADKWVPYLTCETPVVPAKLRNKAGIIGAALAAERKLRP
ncbi:ROK family protein [Corynebacterium glucuronolyticum]|uniref:polyphosphate--glucose phosphotransferase n=1 Tax=Corynebacterium glucuronolyticum TaxID=39791 RepID=UPI003F6DD9CC